jgi:hypothetical protein
MHIFKFCEEVGVMGSWCWGRKNGEEVLESFDTNRKQKAEARQTSSVKKISEIYLVVIYNIKLYSYNLQDS